ncbi:anti-sigma-D factor RsdA [Mycolicibacterium pulveris]|uniref:anti-sigma-D factor RsdA n=1 Tax=Mycolicibacterium pulveris TaxID=36813 RepID=UPI003CF5ABAE
MPDFGRWNANGGDPSLNDINRTDRFLDALAFEQPVYATDPGEAELAQLLAGWRDDVRDAPLTATVTPRDAVLALDRATVSRRRTRSLAVVGSAAAAVLCLGGFGAVVAGAGPGDALYGLRTMLFGEQQTTRDDPVMLASQQFAEVQQLIDEGQWQAAQDKLQTLTTTVATVDDVERKQEFVSEWQELTVKVQAQDAAATIPPDVPPPVFPEVPVAVLDTTTSVTVSPSPSDTTAPSPTDVTTLPSPTDTTLPSPSDVTTLPSPSPSPTVSPTPSPTAAPSPTPSPTASPAPTSAPSPTSSPAQRPTPTSAVQQPPSSTATQLPAPSPSPTATPTQAPQTTEVATTQPQTTQPQTTQQVTTTQAPTQQSPTREVSKTVVTTTTVVPEPDSESG